MAALRAARPFRWRRASVPAYLPSDAALGVDFRRSPANRLGLLTDAAEAWAAAAGGASTVEDEACRGGDLGCGEGHCYAPVLDRALAAWVPQNHHGADEPVRLLELGVCMGHSLATWQEYLTQRFGGEPQVLGVDLDLSALRRHAPRLAAARRARGLDRGDRDAVGAIEGDLWELGSAGALDDSLASAGPFDIIVDDASHADEQVVHAFERLFFDERIGLRPGGVYVVLDTQASFRGEGSRLSHFKALADAAQWQGETIVTRAQLDLYVAVTPSPQEAWIESVEFYRGLMIVRKRLARRS